MRITGSIDGDIAKIIADEQSTIAANLRRGMEAAAAAVQVDLRGMTRAAGLGSGLEKAWQKQVYPRAGKPSLGPAALVYGKSKVLFAVFSEGATIVPKKGRFLAIPTKEAEALGFGTSNTTRAGTGAGSIPRRVSMVQQAISRVGEANVRFVPAKKGRVLVIYRAPTGRGRGQRLGGRGRGLTVERGKDVPLFILVPQVKISSRIDLAGARTRAQAMLAAEIGAALGG